MSLFKLKRLGDNKAMATALNPLPHAEDRTVLREITWETYVRLCDENQSHATQMAYFEGELEIMTAGWPHDTAKEPINFTFALIAESLDLDFQSSGQHTFRHKRKKIGFEADLRQCKSINFTSAV